MRLKVKVIPKSSKNSIVGWEGENLKIRLHAVPEKGKANEELIDFLSEVLGIAKSRIHLLKGQTGRQKELELEGFSEQDLLKVLAK